MVENKMKGIRSIYTIGELRSQPLGEVRARSVVPIHLLVELFRSVHQVCIKPQFDENVRPYHGMA